MRAEPRYEGKFQWLARLGFAVRGLLYIIIAILVIATGRTEDLTGAMEYVGDGAGRLLLIVMIAGMTAYGTWRLGDAAFGMDSGRAHAKAYRRRLAAAGSGAVYLGLALKAVQILLGGRASGGTHEEAAAVLRLPSGGLLLIAASVALAGAAAAQFYKATSCSFLERLDERARGSWAKWLGRSGYGARGIVFLVAAYLLARAGLDHRSAGAGGLEQVLDALSFPARSAVAAGLMLFGAFSMVEARYRPIHKPPVKQAARKMRDEMAR